MYEASGNIEEDDQSEGDIAEAMRLRSRAKDKVRNGKTKASHGAAASTVSPSSCAS